HRRRAGCPRDKLLAGTGAGSASLNPKAGWNHGVFWHHDDPVADEVVIGVQVELLAFGRNHDLIADAGVFIDDRAVDHAIATNSDRRQVGRLLWRGAFKMISTHDHAVANRRAAPDYAAHPNYATFDMR